MKPNREGSFDVTAAASQMEEADRLVRRERRWDSWGLLGFGVVTVGYFAGIGAAPLKTATAVGTIFPVIAVLVFLEVRSKHPPRRSRDLQRKERVLSGLYLALVLAGGLMSDFVAHPFPALLVGIPAGVVCGIGAVWADRR